MADVSPRAFTKTNVFKGRVTDIKVYTASGTPTDIKLYITGLNPTAAFTATEEVKGFTVELEDGTEMTENVARRLQLEVTISELDTTDIAVFNAGTKIILATEGTVKTLTVDAPDLMYARNQNMKTVVTVIKSTTGNTLPYAVA